MLQQRVIYFNRCNVKSSGGITTSPSGDEMEIPLA